MPNIKLDKVSSTCLPAGPIFTINAVLQFPPNESYRILVNLESLKGTNVCFGPVNAWIHFPNAVNE